MDYVTRYPEAVPLQKATPQNIARELLKLFTRVSIAKEILTDQGSRPPGVVVRQRPYRVPEVRHHTIEEEVECMLRDGIIEESASPWSSPIVLVLKPTEPSSSVITSGGSISEFNSYPVSQVDDLVECLGKARFVSTLNLTKGYCQVLPFDLPPSSILWTSSSGPTSPSLLPWSDHLFHLRGGAGWPSEGRADGQPLQVPSGANRSTVPGVLHRLGVATPPGEKGGSHRGVPPVGHEQTDLARNSQLDQVLWTAEIEQAFICLKEALSRLQTPLHRTHTDTSKTRLLSQDFDGEKHLVLFITRKLTPTKKNYTAVEKTQAFSSTKQRSCFQQPHLPSTVVSVSNSGGRWALELPICGNFLDEMDTLLSVFPSDSTPLTVLGDFNFPSDKLHSSGLLALLNLFSFNSCPPTHKEGNILDLVFTHPSPATDMTVTPLHISDHHLVSFTITLPVLPKSISQHLSLTRRNLHSISPSSVASCTLSSLPDHESFSSLPLDSATDTLLSSLSSTMDLLCPLSTIRRKNSSPAPWLSDVLRNNRRELRSAARKWKKSKLDTDLISYRMLLSKFSLKLLHKIPGSSTTSSRHYSTLQLHLLHPP
ncbi:hypothetical protein QTP70_001633 [Hemibagrus guttatus]|uniref:Endonuclease/exonuclease/phosphatase domain-containing protein n=1 Tax=Hemibagrus guttatus TaxID=175788 RepID=A0AAE0V7X6_9TELE|nr:hypothetical protein QTP70_001633 [Hemibagrus guttatus]